MVNEYSPINFPPGTFIDIWDPDTNQWDERVVTAWSLRNITSYWVVQDIYDLREFEVDLNHDMWRVVIGPPVNY